MPQTVRVEHEVYGQVEEIGTLSYNPVGLETKQEQKQSLLQIKRVLENILGAVNAELREIRACGEGNGELQMEVTLVAGQAWQNKPIEWGVFEASIKFSAGPCSVFSEPVTVKEDVPWTYKR